MRRGLPLSKRSFSYVLDAQAAMDQQPQGLSQQDVAEVMAGFLNAGVTPSQAEFRSALARKWVALYWPVAIPKEEAKTA